MQTAVTGCSNEKKDIKSVTVFICLATSEQFKTRLIKTRWRSKAVHRHGNLLSSLSKRERDKKSASSVAGASQMANPWRPFKTRWQVTFVVSEAVPPCKIWHYVNEGSFVWFGPPETLHVRVRLQSSEDGLLVGNFTSCVTEEKKSKQVKMKNRTEKQEVMAVRHSKNWVTV